MNQQPHQQPPEERRPDADNDGSGGGVNVPVEAPAETEHWNEPAQSGPRVVVLGGGFAGIEVAKALGKAGIPTTLIDRHNHHLFQPLLYQVATAALSAPDIAEPIRSILRDHSSVEVLLGEVTEIDHAARRVRCAHGAEFGYEYLVLATGAQTGYFGRDEWRHVAPGLKTIDDARHIRTRLLMNFEKAERCEDPTERERLMTVAVVGGGPTGVEMAGSIAELSRHALARDFRRIRPEETRVMLVEGGEQLLAGFDQSLSYFAQRRLERLGVKVFTGKRVEHIEEDELGIGDSPIPVGMVIWAAGVSASPLGRQLGVETDRSGRVAVSPTLEIPDRPGIFALGALALFKNGNGRPLPGLAQVAKQQGRHLGVALARRIKTGAELPPFTYKSRGNTAIVGRHAAIYETARLKTKGASAWLLWAIVHVYLLVGFQHRVIVSIQWLWRYLTYERGARLISAADDATAGSSTSTGNPELDLPRDRGPTN